jgi:hypothetical protein
MSKGSLFRVRYFLLANTHLLDFFMCVQNKPESLCRLKINHMSGSETCVILGKPVLMVANAKLTTDATPAAARATLRTARAPKSAAVAALTAALIAAAATAAQPAAAGKT